MTIIQTLKNLGVWLASYTLADIKVDQSSFLYALLIYTLISVPSDLVILKVVNDGAQKET